MIGNLDIGDNKIINVGRPQNNKDTINLGFLIVELASKPNINTVLLRDGMQEMNNNLNMTNNKIINVKNATTNSDAVNLQQLNEANSVLATTVSNSHMKKDGATLLTGNLNLNGHKLINMSSPVNKNDGVNKLYLDQKIGESHIISHENRKNVFEYITDKSGEFTADYGINSVNLILEFPAPKELTTEMRCGISRQFLAHLLN